MNIRLLGHTADVHKTCLHTVPHGKLVLSNFAECNAEGLQRRDRRAIRILVLIVENGRDIEADGYVTLGMEGLLNTQTI